MKTIIQSLRIYLVLTLLTGLIYPLAFTVLAQAIFPRQANGSRVSQGDKVIGSDLLAQNFQSAKYFWPRPKFGADAPVDLLTASGSGLDPHISPEATRAQIARVASARSLAPEKLAALVEEHIEQPQLGFVGDPRVNVLLLNLALDRIQQ
jgi:K+-transporting ATPase ATPase C chain